MLSGYEVKQFIGKGGMGAVYEARHVALDRPVAVKFLPFERCAGDHAFADRARREARLLSRLQHPNIVTVFDFGTTAAGDLYFTMELVNGETLSRRLRRSRLNLGESIALLRQVCAAVGHAHHAGVVHRDLKPSNILITGDGRVKVVDFGLAVMAVQPEEEKLTHSGVAVGTFDYSAPEQMQGREVDTRADIYSLGVIAYELLTGEVPRGAFDPPSLRRTAVDPGFDPVVVRALQTDRERRFATVEEFQEALLAAHETALLAGAGEVVGDSLAQVLQDYYQKTMTGVPETVRIFIEDKLLTPSGYRDSRPLDDAVQQHGIARAELQRLVERRLLRIEERAGVPRVEISHDRLTGAIQASRDARRTAVAAREAREREHQLRRRMTRRAGLALVAGLALAAGVWGWSQQREARQHAANEAEARRQLLAMADLAGGELADRLEPIGRLHVLDPLIEGMESLFARYRPAREDAAWNQLLARFLTQKASALAGRGRYTAACAALRDALALPGGLAPAAATTGRTRLMRFLSLRGLAAESLAEWPALVAQLPSLPAGADTDHLSALALSEHSRALQTNQEWDEGLRVQRTAIALMEKALAALPPDHAERARREHDLALAFLRLASAEADEAAIAAAEAAARQGTDIATRLAAAPRTDPRWLATHAQSHGVLGNVLLAAKNTAAADEAFAKYLTLTRALVARDPENMLWLREHARALAETGAGLRSAKKTAEAAPYFDEAIAAARRIAAGDPTVEEWQWDLATYLLHRGYLEQDRDRQAAAEPWLREAIAVMEPFALSTDAPVSGRLHGLGVALVNLGGVLRALGRDTDAAAHYTSWIERARRDAGRGPSWHFLAAMMGWEKGDILLTGNDLPAALAVLESARNDLASATRLLPRNDWPSPSWAWRARPAGILIAAVDAASPTELAAAKRLAAAAADLMLQLRHETIPQKDADACAALREAAR